VAEGFARSQCWWPEFGDLRELIEGQEFICKGSNSRFQEVVEGIESIERIK
jgi:hypothetical protein